VSRFYLRRDPGSKETLGAMAVALGVGAVSFYFVRNLLAREGLEREAPKRSGTTGSDVSRVADSGN
jgi:hypothetical protein